MVHDLGRPFMDEAQDWERPSMGQPIFRGEPEVLVGPRIGIGLVWEGQGQGGA